MKLQSLHFRFKVPMQFPADFIALQEGHLYSHLLKKNQFVVMLCNIPVVVDYISRLETISAEVFPFEDPAGFTCNVPLFTISYQKDVFSRDSLERFLHCAQLRFAML